MDFVLANRAGCRPCCHSQKISIGREKLGTLC